MYAWKAKKLKKGDRVLWRGSGPQIEGTVVKKYYDTIWIEWDGSPADVRTKWFASCMDHIFTQEQLDKIEQEKMAVEAVKQMNADRLKTHDVDGKKIQPKGHQP